MIIPIVIYPVILLPTFPFFLLYLCTYQRHRKVKFKLISLSPGKGLR